MNNVYLTTPGGEQLIEAGSREYVRFKERELISFEVIRLAQGYLCYRSGNRNYNLTWFEKEKNLFGIYLNGNYFECSLLNKTEKLAQELTGRQQAAETSREVKSPMPGLVVQIKLKEGERVSAGQTVMILEAMKMENDIKSPVEGTLSAVYVKEGVAVEKGYSLFLIEK